MTKRKMLLSMIIVIMVLLVAAIIQLTSAKIGTGHLYVYIYSDYATLAPQDDKGFYEILPGQEVYIQIANITEFELGESIIVKIGFEVDGDDYTYTTGPYEVKVLESGEGTGMNGTGDIEQIIKWKVGDYTDPPPGGYIDIPISTTITVHYKNASATGPDYLTFDATPPCKVAHMHAVPEYPIGTLGAITLLLTSFALYHLIKTRKAVPAPKF